MLDKEFHFMLLQCYQASNSKIVKEISHLGLFPGQPKILEYLLEHPKGLQPIEIAQGCFLDKSTVTGLLNRMENMKLIKRKENTKDKRSSLIFMTPLGKKHAMKVKEIVTKVDDIAFEHIDHNQREVFMNVFNQILDNLR